jgi:ParB/RepB/Spo0J family partition protein
MTSGAFRTIPLSAITVNRGERQRRKLEKIEELAESIRTIGLINPPVVTPDFILVAGERRLEAMRSLGYLECPVQLTTDLDPVQLHLIELEENTKRLDLSWQDQNDAIAAYHALKKKLDPTWTQEKTGEALGLSPSSINTHLTVNEQKKFSPDVAKAEKFSTAASMARRKVERAKTTVLRDLGIETEEGDADPRFAEILNTSFLDWAQRDRGRLFNFIHCDFPYGVNTGDKSGQSAAKLLGSYDDSPDTYFTLIETILENLDNFCAKEAHLMFWYSMKFHSQTVAMLTSGGWSVDPFPLIWVKSDNMGILPDQNRGPRRIYETALFASRGDRKIVRPVSNACFLPTTKEFHTSEKPAAVLSHFFRMFVDESSSVLDPTCGSGMAVRVAEEMGASYALGIEMNEEFAESARINCKL